MDLYSMLMNPTKHIVSFKIHRKYRTWSRKKGGNLLTSLHKTACFQLKKQTIRLQPMKINALPWRKSNESNSAMKLASTTAKFIYRFFARGSSQNTGNNRYRI